MNTTAPQIVPEPQTLDVGGFSITNPKVARSFAKGIQRRLDGIETGETIDFPFGKLLVFKGGMFVVETSDEQTRDRLVIEHDAAFAKEGFFAKPLEGGYQMPENSGQFDYRGRHYAIFYAFNRFSETTNEFAWNGVVLDVAKYLEASGQKESVGVIGRIGEAVKDIVAGG